MIIPAASFAISVPEAIANPTSDFFKAGASLVPSPVTATTLPNYINPVTRINLSSGVERASTRKSRAILANISILATLGITGFYYFVPTLIYDFREC